ncbi:tetratricopeptide repeat protein [Allorhodopirellula solitaria]|uniref:Tetratricopeptide repeat protein n=1 Tax=Allorhodopirellula solitaria TaxID=2527987 RepID=A0A5C5YBZ4_9BACT|nr:tetratricopeptide repeat protein [Allorhodopirellula solitaria]TWT73237.1 Tetratricopeptide repeat protein [Allorhodopirellula solitaria]
MTRLLLLFLFFTATTIAAQETVPSGSPDVKLTAEEQQIHQFFDDYQNATQADSVAEQTDFFDFEELARDVVERSGVAIEPGLQTQLAAAMRAQVERQFEMLDAPWTRHQIAQIDFSRDGAVADVFVRCWSEELGTARELYVLKQIDGKWRICDVSQLSLGVSTVALAAMGLRDTMQSNIVNELAYGMNQLLQSIIECTQGNIYAAMDHIEAVVGHPIAESMQTLRWIISAVTHGAIDPARTIESLEKADAFGESTLLADYLRGEAYSELGRFDVAVQYFRAYLGQFGADADAYHSLGYALENLDRTDEAIEAYRAALEDTPESIANVSALARALPEDRKSELAAFYENLPDPIGAFETLGDTLVYDSDAAGLETLIDATVAIDPDAPYLDYYRAMLDHLHGNHLAAFDALAASLEGMETDSESRTWYEFALCDVARRCDRLNEAYAICVDKSQAMDVLADRTDNDGELLPDAVPPADVDELVDEFLSDHENDFDALMLVGRSMVGREQYDRAREFFVTAMELADDSDQRDEALEQCVYCYVDMDRPLDAYNDLEPKAEVVDMLEYALDDEKLFEEVIDQLREDAPHSLRFQWTTLQEMLENGDHENGLNRVTEVLEHSELPVDETYQRESLQVYRTRFLIGLKRYDDAILAAYEAGEHSRDFLRALIYAAKGDRRKFIAAYDKCLALEGMYNAESFAEADEVPASWLPDPAQQNRTDDNGRFSSYSQVRRVVLLLDEPRRVNAGRVIETAQALGEPLYAIERRQMTAEEDDYVFQANGNCVIMATENCRYFLHSSDGPYLHDADQLAAEIGFQDDLSDRIGKHSAWLAIDIFQWPQRIDQEGAQAIPQSASKRLARFAEYLAGDAATVAIHADTDRATLCDAAFFEKLASDDPMSAFENEVE